MLAWKAGGDMHCFKGCLAPYLTSKSALLSPVSVVQLFSSEVSHTRWSQLINLLHRTVSFPSVFSLYYPPQTLCAWERFFGASCWLWPLHCSLTQRWTSPSVQVPQKLSTSCFGTTSVYVSSVKDCPERRGNAGLLWGTPFLHREGQVQWQAEGRGGGGWSRSTHTCTHMFVFLSP